MLVNDGGGVTVCQAELVAEPLDPILEAAERGTGLQMLEPLGKILAGRLGDSGDQQLMRLFGVV